MTRKHLSRPYALAGLILWTTACIGDVGTAPPPSSPPPSRMSSLAQVHLDEVLNTMQANSIKRLTVDWPALRSSAYTAVGAAQTVAQIIPGVRRALELIGDGHSSYTAANGTFLFVSQRTCQSSGAVSPTNLPPNIGYVRVGAFSGSAAQAQAFSNGIHSVLRTADRDSLLGWIVDLRGNGGGNMWPMIAGLGPILGEELLGWFIDPAAVQQPWEYRDAASWLGTSAIHRVTSPYTLIKPNPKVAVLVDNGVASSGEATFIAFRKRANTRSFGMATCGLSTANGGFRMNDGALLNLTVAYMADRTKETYGDQVEPDEIIQGTTAVVDRAVAWLQTPTAHE